MLSVISLNRYFSMFDFLTHKSFFYVKNGLSNFCFERIQIVNLTPEKYEIYFIKVTLKFFFPNFF